MNKELNICKESDIYDSNFEVTFQLNGLEYWCNAYVRYDHDGCYLTDHAFEFELEPFDFDDIQKHELITSIDEYFSNKYADDYLQKHESDSYDYYEQCREDESIENYYL